MAPPTDNMRPESGAPAPLRIDPQRVSQAGVMELLRVGASLTYGDLGALSGLGADRAREILTGASSAPAPAELTTLRDLLWERVPFRPSAAVPEVLAEGTVSVEEAAQLLALSPDTMRHAVSRVPQLQAFRLSPLGHIRIPRRALTRYFLLRCGLSAEEAGGSVSLREAARLLGVGEKVIRWNVDHGRILALRAHPRARIRIPRTELEKALAAGVPARRDRAQADAEESQP